MFKLEIFKVLSLMASQPQVDAAFAALDCHHADSAVF